MRVNDVSRREKERKKEREREREREAKYDSIILELVLSFAQMAERDEGVNFETK